MPSIHRSHYQRAITKLCLLVALCLLLVTASCKDQKTGPPNIVLIMADDLGFETLGINGGESYQTPRLDKLAREGMRFTQAYSMSLCTPSRVQIMTGKYNFRNYIGFGLLDPDERTFGHLLKEAGYHTAVVGKWQLYGNARQRELFGRSGALPAQAGFDEHALWQVHEKNGSRFKDPWLEVNGAPDSLFSGEYGPDFFADFATRFFERNVDNPFFLYYPMVLTHDPFRPTPLSDEYAAFDPVGSGVNDPAWFGENVTYMDVIVGRLVDKLEELGLRENTLLLFVGDNGTDRDVTSQWRGESVSGKKGLPIRRGNHVPMIASWPGTVAAGSVNEELIDFTDFVPTFLEAARSERPSDLTLDGLSFLPQLSGDSDSTRSWVFHHYAPRWGQFEHVRFVHDQRWKLYESGRFYDMQADPEEKNDLASGKMSQAMVGVMNQFRRVLDEMPGSVSEDADP